MLQAGQHERAADAFSAALAEAPDFADAAQNLGCCLAVIGRLKEAAATYALVVQLRPYNAGSRFNLGCVLLDAGEHTEAIIVLREAVRLDPGLAKHHTMLGQALIAADRKAEASAVLREAARLDGSNPAVLASLASLLVDEGQFEAAAGAAMQAVELAPENAHAQANLARALHCLNRGEQALGPALAAVRLAPCASGAVTTLGAIHYTLGNYAEAAVHSRRAARLDPALYQAKINEALALEALGRLEEAEAAGWKAIALAPPENAEVRHNLASVLLASGRMTSETWTLYESRLRLNPALAKIAALPRWAGEDVAGRTVLLHSEQGFGDTIQFARYLPLVKARGARVVLAVQPALLRLLRDIPGADAVVSALAPLPAYDVFCPLLSLPGIFRTALDTIPPPIPLLPDPGLVQHWQRSSHDGLQVGLVWAGSPGFVHDRARSVGPALIAALAGIPGVELHSLQLAAAQTIPDSIIDRMAPVTDFADTAAIIAGLDLIIAVDSAVAHLAAAMGKQVWLLSRFVGCWRWLRDREDSPWYPTMRIYRQAQPGDWAAVLERVRGDLSRRVAGLPALSAPPSVTVRRTTALDDLDLPDGAPRAVVALVGENENGILRSVSQDFMGLLSKHGLSGHVVDLTDHCWLPDLTDLVNRGVLFAWGSAGVGARLQHRNGSLWDAVKVPFVSVMADSPCWMPANHHVPSRYVANGYMFRDWLNIQRRLIRSPQISGLLQQAVLPNPAADDLAWTDRPRRMVFVKTGCDPALHQAKWQALPRRFRAVLEDSAALALRQGVSDISDTVLQCLRAQDLFVETRPDLLFGLMQEVDVYVRDYRSTVMARALLNLPAEIIGRGWEHVATPGCKARFRPAIDGSLLAGLYSETQFLLNTMPNFAHGTHERVLNGFAAKCCVVTNENADMRTQFGDLPSYFALDTEASGLADELAELFNTKRQFDDSLEAAQALVQTTHAPEMFLRSMIDLALEVMAGSDFESFGYG